MNHFYLAFDVETTGLPNDFDAPPEEIENWPEVIEIA